MRFRVCPNLTIVLLKRGIFEHHTCTGRTLSRDWSYAATSHATTRSYKGGLEWSCLQREGGPAPRLLLFKTINFSFLILSLWHFVMAALANKCHEENYQLVFSEHIPSVTVSSWCQQTHLVLTKSTLGARCYNYSLFINEDTKAQRGEGACLTSAGAPTLITRL